MQQQRKLPMQVPAGHAEKPSATTERSDDDAGLRRLTYSPEKPASAAAPQGSHLVATLGDNNARSIQTHASSNRESSVVVVAAVARAPLLSSSDQNCAVVTSSAAALTHDKKPRGGGLVDRKKQSCVTGRPPSVPPTSGRSKSQVTEEL